MPFDDPEESQDETVTPESRQQRSAYFPQFGSEQTPDQQNQGGNPEVVKGLMEMMKQYRTPPGPNGEYYKRVYPPMPEPEPEPTSGEKIMALRYPEGSPERERFWKPEKTVAEKLAEVIRPGRNLPPPSRLQIVKDPNAVGAGPPWPQESQSIFRHFYPGMSEAEIAGTSSTTQNPGESAHGVGQMTSGRSGNNPPVVNVSRQVKAPSRIFSQAPSPQLSSVRDDRQEQRTLNRMMGGIRNPSMIPSGVAPDGSPVLNVTSLVKAPSRIPRQYEAGENFSNIDIARIKTAEGGTRRNGHVPHDDTGKSGVTIAAGFDIGQYSLAELRNFGFSKELTTKLSPYANLKGQNARDAVAKTPLAITREEASQIDNIVLNSKLNAAAKAFDDKVGNTGEFSKLPWHAQSVIADLWYNMGDLRKAAPRLWEHFTSGDWEAAYRNLRSFSHHPGLAARARRDAELIRDAIDIGVLPDY